VNVADAVAADFVEARLIFMVSKLDRDGDGDIDFDNAIEKSSARSGDGITLDAPNVVIDLTADETNVKPGIYFMPLLYINRVDWRTTIMTGTLTISKTLGAGQR
jgi:hypothetical protein